MLVLPRALSGSRICGSRRLYLNPDAVEKCARNQYPVQGESRHVFVKANVVNFSNLLRGHNILLLRKSTMRRAAHYVQVAKQHLELVVPSGRSVEGRLH